MENRLLAGRYRLLEPLGRGGMGQVRRAWDESLARPVAVKTLELDGTDPAPSERFRREARTTARLTHPNIVTVFDTGTDDATAFLVMELLPGPSLRDRLRRQGPLPAAEAAGAVAQVAAALAAAHAAGVVHRDVKPSNAVYAAGGKLKVLDFGIARLIETATGAARLTRTATVIGTAAYLSPEQASGGPVGPRSDLYALGCVLFELLTGAPPFTGDTPVAVCAQHVHAPPPDLAAVCPGCPAALAALTRELLSKDPAARPPGAAAVRDRLAPVAGPWAALSAEPGPAEPGPAEPGAGERVSPPGLTPTAAAGQPQATSILPRLPLLYRLPLLSRLPQWPGPPQLPRRPRLSRRSGGWSMGRVAAACAAAAGAVAAAAAILAVLSGGPQPHNSGTAPQLRRTPAAGAQRASAPAPRRPPGKQPGKPAGSQPGHGGPAHGRPKAPHHR